MKKYAPLATLVAVVLLGGALMVANMLTAPSPQAAAPAAVAAPEAPATPAAPAQAAPEPSTAASAAPAAPAVEKKAYTGRSAGNEVTVAVAVKDGKAVAYVCDGKKVESWMEGTLAGGTLTLSGKTGSIAGTVDEKATFGTVTVDGKEWPFSATGVQAPAGLYEGRGNVNGVVARMGWIVEDDGTVTGVGSFGGVKRTAPALEEPAPGTLIVDGDAITVIAVDGGTPVVPR